MAYDAQIGNDVTVWLNMGTEVAPDYQQVEGQRDYTHDTSRTEIDASHKGSDHTVTVVGRQSGTISVTLVVQTAAAADATHAKLEDSYNDRLPVWVQENSTFPGAAVDGSEDGVKAAKGYVVSFTKNGPDEDVATLDVSITLVERLAAA